MNLIKYIHELLQKSRLGEIIYIELHDIIVNKNNDNNRYIIEKCLNKNINKDIILYDLLLYYLLIITTDDNEKYIHKLYELYNNFLIQNDNIKNKLTKTNECYNCYHKRNIPGDSHIQCINPDKKMIGKEHGIKKGWFYYPFNFDPIWKLKRCNNFIFMEKIYDKKL
jgi:hypothetical protein